MRLPLRWKLLLLLAGLAVLPLLTLAWLDIRALAHLGATLATQSGLALSEQALANLESHADSYAALVGTERQVIELIVSLQAREASEALQRPAADTTPQWTAELAETPAAADPRAARYQAFSNESTHAPLNVFFDRLSFYLPPGAQRDALTEQAQRLATLQKSFAATRDRFDNLLHWQYVSLESGLHASYPGHGGYPPEYDARRREWYIAQQARHALTWSRPHRDATTRQRLLSATMPLYDAQGGFIGVTGVDVQLTRLLNEVRLPSNLATAGQVLLTTLDAEARIEILARQSFEDHGGDWQERAAPEFLTAESSPAWSSVIAQMRAGQDGQARLRLNGQSVFCVYRAIAPHATYLAFIVPSNAVVQPASDAAEYALATTRRQVNTLVPFTAAVALITALLALWSARSVTNPLRELAAAVNQAARGNFAVRVNLTSGDELQDLGQHFNQMIPQIGAHVATRQALAVAREVQQRLLPSEAPHSALLDIHGHCEYADETGGDYFDYLISPANGEPHKLAVLIGDVSGHGVGAALLMTTARAYLNARDFDPTALSAELGRLNESLAEDVHAGHFMTLFILLFDLEARTICWASAGHEPALHWRASTTSFADLAGTDIPLGIDRQWTFHFSAPIPFAAGDVFVLCTDGVTEARAPDGTRFGKQGLRVWLGQHHTRSAHELCGGLEHAVSAFRQGLAQHDDQTVVVIKARS